MWNNDVCPITLERLDEKRREQIFVHRDIGMDIDALYTYLTKSLYFTNPVNRVPFEIEELCALEEQVKTLHGLDAIDQRSSTDNTPGTPTTVDGPPFVPDADEDLLTESELLSRIRVTVTTQEGDGDNTMLCIDVNLDITDLQMDSRTASSEPTSLNGSVVGSSGSDDDEKSEVEEKTEEAATEVDDRDEQDGLKFPLQSVVKLFLDTGRSGRMKDELNLLQFLQYESADLLNQIMDIVSDTFWQQWVWEQTCPSVLEVVAEHTGRSTGRDSSVIEEIVHDVSDAMVSATNDVPIDLQLEVHYSENWEAYRVIVLNSLERQYFDVCCDVADVAIDEFRVLTKGHQDTVDGRVQNESWSSLVNDIIASVRSRIDPMYVYHRPFEENKQPE
jgi:hypothetical protein